jgi:hypothetical protein
MIGEHIEHYRILQHVGGGGMGTVYRALDTMLEREVALKILRGDLSDQPDVTKRFRAEAVTLARLSHPHIARSSDSCGTARIHADASPIRPDTSRGAGARVGSASGHSGCPVSGCDARAIGGSAVGGLGVGLVRAWRLGRERFGAA